MVIILNGLTQQGFKKGGCFIFYVAVTSSNGTITS